MCLKLALGCQHHHASSSFLSLVFLGCTGLMKAHTETDPIHEANFLPVECFQSSSSALDISAGPELQGMSSTATQSQRTCRPNSECLSSPQSRGGICVSQAGVLNMTTCHAGRLTRRERQPTLTQEVVRDPELARQRKRRYHRLQVGSHITWLLVGLMIPPGGQHAPSTSALMQRCFGSCAPPHVSRLVSTCLSVAERAVLELNNSMCSTVACAVLVDGMMSYPMSHKAHAPLTADAYCRNEVHGMISKLD